MLLSAIKLCKPSWEHLLKTLSNAFVTHLVHGLAIIGV